MIQGCSEQCVVRRLYVHVRGRGGGNDVSMHGPRASRITSPTGATVTPSDYESSDTTLRDQDFAVDTILARGNR
jgi:hypothetical protein